MTTKRTPTTKDVGLLRQLYEQQQLVLAPEFQRNSVWPPKAKAYLIDTILKDRPIPLLYFQRTTSAQTGKPSYSVIDGQQRLRAILEFLDNRFGLSESESPSLKNKRFNQLSPEDRERLLGYDLYVQELVGYTDADIRDMFVRMNRFVVKLAPQEIRHAEHKGRFAEFVEKVGRWSFWREHQVFSQAQANRMRAVEFAAEATILVLEGPQDKKQVIDMYYKHYAAKFPEARLAEDSLRSHLEWIAKALPNLKGTRFRSPVDLYGILGALQRFTTEKAQTVPIDPKSAGPRLLEFERSLKVDQPQGRPARYLASVGRQTDNLLPRSNRIEVLESVIRGE